MTTRARRTASAAIAALFLVGLAGSAGAVILVHISGVQSDSQIPGYEGWFVADSFSFGVEREMKESGEKGGTSDINIGIGELQEVSISRSLDAASSHLAQFAINGNSIGTLDIAFVQTTGDDEPVTYLRYRLDRCFVKSWSTSADAGDRPTEYVTFYYNKIAFTYVSTTKAASYSAGWDRVKNVPWSIDGAKIARNRTHRVKAR